MRNTSQKVQQDMERRYSAFLSEFYSLCKKNIPIKNHELSKKHSVSNKTVLVMIQEGIIQKKGMTSYEWITSMPSLLTTTLVIKRRKILDEKYTLWAKSKQAVLSGDEKTPSSKVSAVFPEKKKPTVKESTSTDTVKVWSVKEEKKKRVSRKYKGGIVRRFFRWLF